LFERDKKGAHRPRGTYYIYAIDGRLLAEYNGLGFCVRECIYMGGKLLAEYRPADNRYYYYTSDQIGSTRIVTDQNGVVVYAVAHDPYGGIQQTWESGYDPVLKFSGKERDTESGLDYFGARYYDHTLYRFLSVDPLIPTDKALYNPQSWNLYGYCLGNPVGYVDTTGADAQKFIIEIRRYKEESGICTGKLYTNGELFCWTLENCQFKILPGTYKGELISEGEELGIKLNATTTVYDPTTKKLIKYVATIKPGLNPLKAHNCIYLSYVFPENGLTVETWEAWYQLMERIQLYQENMARDVAGPMEYINRSFYGSPLDMVFAGFSALEALGWMIDDWYKMQIEIQVVIMEAQ
jgi:RHS repeat-associated protein